MSISAEVWKMTHEKNSPECVYRLQVKGIKGAREEKRVSKAMLGWEFAGDGFNSRTKEITMFFRRDFGSVEKFLAWGKNFQDFPLVELDVHGEVKKYVRIGPRGGSSKGSKGGTRRVCSICGQPGHNARTCPQRGNQPAVKAEVKMKTATKSQKSLQKKSTGNKYKCSVCGEYGHNKRSCPSK